MHQWSERERWELRLRSDLASADGYQTLDKALSTNIWEKFSALYEAPLSGENPTNNQSYTYTYITVQNHNLIDIINQYYAYALFNQSFQSHHQTRYLFIKTFLAPGVSWVNALSEHVFPQNRWCYQNVGWASLDHYGSYFWREAFLTSIPAEENNFGSPPLRVA